MRVNPSGSSLLVVRLARIPYPTALDFQHQLVELRLADEIPDTLVLLEHPPVITLGRNAGRTSLLVSDAELARRGVELIRVERGGDITFHGPGQLVGYPIFKLKSGVVGVRRFIELVEQSLIHALARHGVTARARDKLIGVWVEDRKLASIGVAVRRGVTFHGFALNVSTDLDWFDLMNPCGLAGVRMTSIRAESGRADWPAVSDSVVRGFENCFGLRAQTNLPRSITSLTNGLNVSAIASASASE